MPVFCGIDWAEEHYDVALVDEAGVVLARRRITDDAAGYRLLLDLLAEHGDARAEHIPVAIETPRGLVVACLRRTGRQVYAINPPAVARYRERHSLARAKSDRVDAELLANILRTDRAAHRRGHDGRRSPAGDDLRRGGHPVHLEHGLRTAQQHPGRGG